MSNPVDLSVGPASRARINRVVLSHTFLAGLYDEDLDDAAEHSGLILLKNDWYARSPDHLDAAYAAYGLPYEERRLAVAHLTRGGLELACQLKQSNRTCRRHWAQHHSNFDPELAGEPLWSSTRTSLMFWDRRRKHTRVGTTRRRGKLAFAT
jgi:hypothetical protein